MISFGIENIILTLNNAKVLLTRLERRANQTQ